MDSSNRSQSRLQGPYHFVIFRTRPESQPPLAPSVTLHYRAMYYSASGAAKDSRQQLSRTYQYLLLVTRPDISYAVNKLAQFQNSPGQALLGNGNARSGGRVRRYCRVHRLRLVRRSGRSEIDWCLHSVASNIDDPSINSKGTF